MLWRCIVHLSSGLGIVAVVGHPFPFIIIIFFKFCLYARFFLLLRWDGYNVASSFSLEMNWWNTKGRFKGLIDLITKANWVVELIGMDVFIYRAGSSEDATNPASLRGHKPFVVRSLTLPLYLPAAIGFSFSVAYFLVSTPVLYVSVVSPPFFLFLFFFHFIFFSNIVGAVTIDLQLPISDED